MRALLLVAVVFACALMGWLVYTQPTSAGNDKAAVVRVSQPGPPDLSAISPVAEEKREQATLDKCDQKASTKRLGRDDKETFILQCLQAADSATQQQR